VLNALLDNQSLGAYGLTLGAEAQFAPGSMHPALTRLEKLGWVESWWHDSAPGEPDHPRRRWYRLTPEWCRTREAGRAAGGRGSHTVGASSPTGGWRGMTARRPTIGARTVVGLTVRWLDLADRIRAVAKS
jgi:PadR family transcriptional regulator PadR